MSRPVTLLIRKEQIHAAAARVNSQFCYDNYNEKVQWKASRSTVHSGSKGHPSHCCPSSTPVWSIATSRMPTISMTIDATSWKSTNSEDRTISSRRRSRNCWNKPTASKNNNPNDSPNPPTTSNHPTKFTKNSPRITSPSFFKKWPDYSTASAISSNWASSLPSPAYPTSTSSTAWPTRKKTTSTGNWPKFCCSPKNNASPNCWKSSRTTTGKTGNAPDCSAKKLKP